MKAKYFKSEDDFYASLPKKKREAVKEYWSGKTEQELANAKTGYLYLEYMLEVEQAATDEEMASSLLVVAACFLEDRRPIPYHLADYIAKAFKAAASTTASISFSTAEAKRNMLASMLNITSSNRRPKSSPTIIGNSVFRLMMQHAQSGQFISETSAVKEVAQIESVGLTQAKEYWKSWKKLEQVSYARLKEGIALFKKRFPDN